MKLLDPDFWLDPYPVFERLRAEAPVAWDDGSSMWTVARHADIQSISRDPATFCSGKGVLPADRERGVTPEASILFLDPPEHHRYRKLVSPAFTPRRMAALDARVRELTVELLTQIEPDQPVEFADAVAAPLPLLVIAELLGIPVEDREKFRYWSDAMIDAAMEPSLETLTIAGELWQYFEGIIEERRTDPADDLVSVLAHAEVDGELLTDPELNGFCMTLLVAGNETTRNLITGGIEALAQNPDQLERLNADPGLVPTAVEEMLRWVTPVMNFARSATRDVEIAGQTIAAGDFLLMLYGSGNRDETVYGNTANQFDVTRNPNPHVSFGFGEHFCMGNALARLEARVLFDEVARRYSTIELTGEPERLRSTLMRSLVKLPVALS